MVRGCVWRCDDYCSSVDGAGTHEPCKEPVNKFWVNGKTRGAPGYTVTHSTTKQGNLTVGVTPYWSDETLSSLEIKPHSRVNNSA